MTTKALFQQIKPLSPKPTPAELVEFSRSVRAALGVLQSLEPQIAALGAQVAKVEKVAAAAGSAEPEVIAPPVTPAGFTATGLFAKIMLQWALPTYRGHAHTEIWRAQTDDLGLAVLVGRESFAVWVDDGLPNSATSEVYYYWIRHVNGNDVAGAFNATAGTAASTADDPAYVLALLAEQITSTQLHASLSTKIVGYDTAIAQLQADVAALTTSPFDADETYAGGELVTHGGNIYQVLTPPPTPTNPTPPNATYYELIGEYASLSELAAANAAALSLLDARVSDAEGDIAAQATSFSALSATVNANLNADAKVKIHNGGGMDDWPRNTTIAGAQTRQFSSDYVGKCLVRVQAYGAGSAGPQVALNGVTLGSFTGSGLESTWNEFIATNLAQGDNTLAVWSSNNDSGYVQKTEVYAFIEQSLAASAKALVASEASARATAIEAEATARETLAVQVGENITAAVQDESIARATADGLAYAERTIKVNAGGKIAGIGIAVQDGESGPITSIIEILSNVFAVAHPTDDEEPSVVPFVVRDNKVVINELLADLIRVKRAMIEALAVDDAKIDSLSVAKLIAGAITAANIFLGSEGKVHLDGPNNRIIIKDYGNVTRVILGKLTVGYGIEIYDSGGQLILGSGGVPLAKVSGAGAFAALSQITAANISTYMAEAAIGNAYIGAAAVGTLEIQGEAVIVPRSSALVLDFNSNTQGVWIDVLTVPITIASNLLHKVVVMANAIITFGTDSNSRPVKARLVRNSTVISGEQVLTNTYYFQQEEPGYWAPDPMYFTPTRIDDPGAGTHTYRLQVFQSAWSGSYTLSVQAGSSLVLLGAKR